MSHITSTNVVVIIVVSLIGLLLLFLSFCCLQYAIRRCLGHDINRNENNEGNDYYSQRRKVFKVPPTMWELYIGNEELDSRWTRSDRMRPVSIVARIDSAGCPTQGVTGGRIQERSICSGEVERVPESNIPSAKINQLDVMVLIQMPRKLERTREGEQLPSFIGVCPMNIAPRPFTLVGGAFEYGTWKLDIPVVILPRPLENDMPSDIFP